MKAILLFSLVAIAALLLQTTVLPQVLRGFASPDLLLIVCVYLALYRHSAGGAAAAFGLGYLQDAFSGSAMGLNAFATSLVFVVIYIASRRLWVDNALSRIAVVFAAAVIKTLAILLLVASFMSVQGIGGAILRSMLFDAVVVALLSPAAFAVLARTHLLAVTEDE